MSSLPRMVRTISSFHATAVSVRNGNIAMGKFIWSRQHFPKFLAATMAASGLTGFFSMQYFQQRHWEDSDFLYEKAKLEFIDHRSFRQNSEKLARSMRIENEVQNESYQVDAQEHFGIIHSISTNCERDELMTKKQFVDSRPPPFGNRRMTSSVWSLALE
mmetsp:Transcript_27228/g.40201  ORF Transcript_27228/g.40201 Transcript_27228/m.40201 type:complete len:160 (+) Transcript_27228:22-501(+)